MELSTDADAAAKFIKGIIPSDIEISDEQLKDIQTKQAALANANSDNQ